MNLAALATIDNHADYALLALTIAVTLPAAAILVRAYWHVRETTLVIPWAWTFGCFALVTATSCYAGLVPAEERVSSFLAIQFAAASGTLCPIVALVGAKRPQHTAWSFVVVSLWLVLALPAAEVICLHPGQELEINSIRGWFLWVLIAVEVSCFTITKYCFAIWWLAVAQVLWLFDWLPLLPESTWLTGVRELFGLWMMSYAIVMAWLMMAITANRQRFAYDRLWLDFRDSFGLFWALKLAERVNDAGQQAGWDFDLGWTGFRTKSSFAPLEKLPPEEATALRNSLQGLLRRFVSAEWISERLDSAVDLAATEAPARQEPRPPSVESKR